MCGIAGHPRVVGVPQGSALEDAVAALEFRGRDGVGVRRFESFALGCARLAITDASAAQPLVRGPTGRRVAIVMNGSIAGPAAWRHELVACGEAPTSGNDAELPLRIWRARGVSGLARLEGQFAFAIYDEGRQCLVLGRDRFGEKPLFVTDGDGMPSFASTVAALRRLAPLARDGGLDLDDAVRFATYGWLDLEQRCFGLDARAFPRGRLRVYDRGGMCAQHSLRAPVRPPATETVRRVLDRAVLERVHGDRPLGVFLSGGIDSACIASALARHGRQALCVSLDFATEAGVRGEGRRAGRIAQALGHRHSCAVAGAGALDALPELVAQAGVPLGDPSLLAVRALARHAADQGLGIVLGGDGGDEIFLGYRRQRAWRWAELAHRMLPRGVLRRVARNARGTGGARLLRAAATGDYACLFEVADPGDVARVFGRTAPADRGPTSTRDESRSVELSQYLAGDLCPKLDHGSLAAGIEARSPFLDARVLAFAERWVHRPGEAVGKPALRALLAESLPVELREGPKRGFAPPIAEWLLESSWVRETLASAGTLIDVRLALRWYEELSGQGRARAPLLFNLVALALHRGARA